MHKVRTRWPVATRISFIVAFEEACRRYPGISARSTPRLQAGENRQPLAGIAGHPRRVRVVHAVLEQPVRELVQVAQREALAAGTAMPAEPLEQLPAAGSV